MTRARCIGILTSGGDCPGLNAAIRGVAKPALSDFHIEVIGIDLKAKDFLTWSGTMILVRALWELVPAGNERIAKLNVNRALDQVAARLRNTRAVCRKYYVHPSIIEAYHRAVVVPAPPTPRSGGRAKRVSAALRREEVGVLQFLQGQLRT